MSLFLAFFDATEATDQGITLWIAYGCMLYARIVGYVAWREERPLRIRIAWIDLCIGTFLSGHLLAGLVALCGQSHQRATINFFWEWIGLLFTYLFLRSLVSHRQSKSQLLATAVLLVTFLAGLGVWQHYGLLKLERTTIVQLRFLRGIDRRIDHGTLIRPALATVQLA